MARPPSRSFWLGRAGTLPGPWQQAAAAAGTPKPWPAPAPCGARRRGWREWEQPPLPADGCPAQSGRLCAPVAPGALLSRCAGSGWPTTPKFEPHAMGRPLPAQRCSSAFIPETNARRQGPRSVHEPRPWPHCPHHGATSLERKGSRLPEKQHPQGSLSQKGTQKNFKDFLSGFYALSGSNNFPNCTNTCYVLNVPRASPRGQKCALSASRRPFGDSEGQVPPWPSTRSRLLGHLGPFSPLGHSSTCLQPLPVCDTVCTPT